MPLSSVSQGLRGALNPFGITRFFRSEAFIRPALLLTCIAIVLSYVFTDLGTAVGKDTNPHNLKALAIVMKDLNAISAHEGNAHCVLKRNTIVETVAQSGTNLVCVPIGGPEPATTLLVAREAAAAFSPIALASVRSNTAGRSLPNVTSPRTHDLQAGKRVLLLARKADWLLVDLLEQKAARAPLGWVRASCLEPLSLTVVSAGNVYEEPSRAKSAAKVSRGEEYRAYGRVQGAGGNYFLVERDQTFVWIPESVVVYSGH